jgi:hypothetical protein
MKKILFLTMIIMSSGVYAMETAAPQESKEDKVATELLAIVTFFGMQDPTNAAKWKKFVFSPSTYPNKPPKKKPTKKDDTMFAAAQQLGLLEKDYSVPPTIQQLIEAGKLEK